MKTIHPDMLLLPSFNSKLRVRASEIANRLEEEVGKKLEESKTVDDMSDIHGLFGMASMYDAYAEGTLSDSQTYNFMSRLAIMKTPQPVQKIEQTTYLDIKGVLRELMSENSTAFTETQELALKRREEIREKLKADNRLMLMKEETKEDEEKNEPEEIRKLRQSN